MTHPPPRRPLRTAALAAALASALALPGCQPESHAVSHPPTPPIPAGLLSQLAFTCAHEAERIPPRHPEADQLYKHARWLYKNNLLKRDPAVYPAMERLLRIATAYGHDKANLELRLMLSRGQASSPHLGKEIGDLVDDLIQRGIPGGYYDMAVRLERGAGVKQDEEKANQYYRKAADLGSPEAQFVVAEKLDPIDEARDIARAMYACAAKQGHKDAANSLAIDFKINGKYEAAREYYQLAVKHGSSGAASSLEDGFELTRRGNAMYIGIDVPDAERIARYAAIRKFLSGYSYLNPTVPELDQIVPLPPAKLPPWDGKFQWLQAHQANTPPPLPTEQRIAEMAKAKGLNPQTGRPLAWGNSGPASP